MHWSQVTLPRSPSLRPVCVLGLLRQNPRQDLCQHGAGGLNVSREAACSRCARRTCLYAVPSSFPPLEHKSPAAVRRRFLHAAAPSSASSVLAHARRPAEDERVHRAVRVAQADARAAQRAGAGCAGRDGGEGGARARWRRGRRPRRLHTQRLCSSPSKSSMRRDSSSRSVLTGTPNELSAQPNVASPWPLVIAACAR